MSELRKVYKPFVLSILLFLALVIMARDARAASALSPSADKDFSEEKQLPAQPKVVNANTDLRKLEEAAILAEPIFYPDASPLLQTPPSKSDSPKAKASATT